MGRRIVSHVNAAAISQLHQQLLQLAAKASQLDKQQPDWQQSARIDNEHFQTRSPYLLDYVQETLQLQQRLAQNQHGASQQLLAEKLSRQLDILLRSFQSDAVRHKEQKSPPRKKANSSTVIQRERAGQLLQQLGGNGQALYLKLSEYHQFELRLQQMVQDAKASQQPVALQLALQARLGRCRKAISAVEAEIEWYEQKGLKR